MILRIVRLLTHTAWISSDLASGGYANLCEVTRERDEAISSLSQGVTPYLSSPFCKLATSR